MELASIIIPAFNAANYLKETLDSVLAQSYEEREIIVVNDGSTDNTIEILSDYSDKIIAVNQENRGDAAACNAGASIANGRWLAFLDADDIWLPEKLEKQVAMCGEAVISFTDSVCFGEDIDGEIRRSSFEPAFEGDVLPQLLVRNFITKSTVMIQRDVFLRYGGFDQSYVLCDWPLWLRICADHRMGYVGEVLARYRVHKSSATAKARLRLPEHLRVIDQFFQPDAPGSRYPFLRARTLASSYAINAHYALESGDWTFAFYCTLRSLGYQPTQFQQWKNLLKATMIPFGRKF